MKVAVTGGAGFVGSHIVRALFAAGHQVRSVDDLSTGKAQNLEATHELRVDDAGAVDYTNADVVVHAAAYPDVSANWKHPIERDRQWTRNADLTRRLLDRMPEGPSSARVIDRPLFVLISTCSVYGGGRHVHETTPTRSTSPYAASKLAAEALVEAYHEAGRVHGVTVRLVNVVGARYAHGHLADFVRQAHQGKIHALDDGAKAKSFVHAGDVADEIVELVRQYSDPAHAAPLDAGRTRRTNLPRLYNLTSRACWSWRDSVAVMRAMRPNRKFELTWEKRRGGWVGDPDELVVHSAHLDARPRRSIVDGVRESLEGLGW